jgi:hypothetical protein
VIQRILRHRGLPTHVPEPRPARAPRLDPNVDQSRNAPGIRRRPIVSDSAACRDVQTESYGAGTLVGTVKQNERAGILWSPPLGIRNPHVAATAARSPTVHNSLDLRRETRDKGKTRRRAQSAIARSHALFAMRVSSTPVRGCIKPKGPLTVSNHRNALDRRYGLFQVRWQIDGTRGPH